MKEASQSKEGKQHILIFDFDTNIYMKFWVSVLS